MKFAGDSKFAEVRVTSLGSMAPGDTTKEVEAHAAQNGSWARTAKDLFSGAAGGVAQVLLGEFHNPLGRQS